MSNISRRQPDNEILSAVNRNITGTFLFKNHTQNAEHTAEGKLFPDRYLKNQNCTYPSGINSVKF